MLIFSVLIKGKHGSRVMQYAANMNVFTMGLKIVRIFTKTRKVTKKH